MKKLKLNKQTVSILGTTEKKMIAGGATGGSPCVNWTSYKATQCNETCDKCRSNGNSLCLID